MSYMVSVCINREMALADLSTLLTRLEEHGDIEDVQIVRVPDRVMATTAVVNGQPIVTENTGNVIVLAPAANETKARATRTRRKEQVGAESAAKPDPASGPQSQVGYNSDSEGSGVKTFPPEAPTVEEGAAIATGSDAQAPTPAAGAAPSTHVTIEALRVFCRDAVQADGSRRAVLTAVLREYGASTLSTLAPERFDQFYARIQKEFA